MAGRELESMTSDLSRWMGAVSDVTQAEKRAKNPPLLRKLFYKDSIESEAIEAFAAKKNYNNSVTNSRRASLFRMARKLGMS